MAHIIRTQGTTGTFVSVATEYGKRGGDVLAVRDSSGTVLMAVPVQHVSKAILSTMFDDVDADAILSRLAE